MRHTDFDVSPHRRIAMGWLVLGEIDGLDPQARGVLLHAMWKGWTEVMRIKIRAELDYSRPTQEGNPQE